MNPGCRVQDQLNTSKPTTPYIIDRELNLRKLPGRQWELNPQPSIQLRPMMIKTSASTETATTANRRTVGSLLYLATNTRPEIAVRTSILARHVCDPTEADWVEGKRIFRYLKHTKQKKMKLANTEKQQNNLFTVFVDADWGVDAEDRISNTGYIFHYLGATIAWTSRKQSMITLS